MTVQQESAGWLTPARCRLLLAAVLVLWAASQVWFLHYRCPVDLFGDEAQYWEWSRNLDLSYYSKGPLVAYIIRGSCAIFGQTMPAVRYPAIALGLGTAILTYLTTLKLFGSDRLALGAVLLGGVIPLYVAGSLVMTIDPPMFFFWAATTYFAALAVFDEKPWAWALVGASIGLGFLAKYSALLWFVGCFLFLLNDRRHLRGCLAALLVAVMFCIPVIVWNARHDWVSLHHVARQTGATGGKVGGGNFFELVASQIGLLNPVLALFITLAIAATVRGTSSVDVRQRRFLCSIGLPFLAATFAVSLFTKVQPNWPAPAYFSLVILGAYFIATRMAEPQVWNRWRGWFWGMIVIGGIAQFLVRDIKLILPAAQRAGINPARMDFQSRGRGWAELGQRVGQELNSLGAGAFVLCDDYMQAGEMAFYVPGQPKTYCAGSYYSENPKRLTQWDIWPDRQLDSPGLLGRDAVFVGKGARPPADIVRAFDRVEEIDPIPVKAGGVQVKAFRIWRCFDFKGMTRPPPQKY